MRLTGTDQVYGRNDQFNGDPVFGDDVRATGGLMRSWTTALVALVVVWVVGVTVTTQQNSRVTRPAGRSASQFSGHVSSASGALTVGGAATNPGPPVSGATV